MLEQKGRENRKKFLNRSIGGEREGKMIGGRHVLMRNRASWRRGKGMDDAEALLVSSLL